MIYEVQARLLFNESDEARDFYHDCEKTLLNSITLNSETDIMEQSLIALIENHHDQDPNAPCSVIELAQSP